MLRNIASFVIIGTALLMVLSDLGINLAPLLASAGVAGVALGFGARDIVTDLLAGIFMLLEDQYGVGDRVDVGEVSGVVLEIGLRVTQLRGDGRRDLVHPQRRDQAGRQPQPGLGDGRARRPGAAERGPRRGPRGHRRRG